MSDDLTISVQDTRGRHAVVQLTGVMDMDTVTPLDDALTGLIDQSHPHLVLDVTRVSFCDSTGLNTLLRTLRRTEAAAGSLALVGASESLRRIMVITGTDTVLTTYPTVEQALEGIPGP